MWVPVRVTIDPLACVSSARIRARGTLQGTTPRGTAPLPPLGGAPPAASATPRGPRSRAPPRPRPRRCGCGVWASARTPHCAQSRALLPLITSHHRRAPIYGIWARILRLWDVRCGQNKMSIANINTTRLGKTTGIAGCSSTRVQLNTHALTRQRRLSEAVVSAFSLRRTLSASTLKV